MSDQSGPAHPVTASGLMTTRNAVLGGTLAATVLATGAWLLLGTGSDDLEEVVSSPVRAPRPAASATATPTPAPVEATALSAVNPFASLIPEQAAGGAGAALGGTAEAATTPVSLVGSSGGTSPVTSTPTSPASVVTAPAAPQATATATSRPVPPATTKPVPTATSTKAATPPAPAPAAPTYTWRLEGIDTAEDGTVTTRWSVGERTVEVLPGARFGKSGEAALQQVKDTVRGQVAVVRTGTVTRALAVGSTLQLHAG